MKQTISSQQLLLLVCFGTARFSRVFPPSSAHLQHIKDADEAAVETHGHHSKDTELA